MKTYWQAHFRRLRGISRQLARLSLKQRIQQTDSRFEDRAETTMQLIRCTKKLQKEMGLKPADLVADESKALGS